MSVIYTNFMYSNAYTVPVKTVLNDIHVHNDFGFKMIRGDVYVMRDIIKIIV